MKVLIISDIHANFPALEAVLAQAQGYDSVWCLGDLVGYGPYPNECIERVRQLPELLCLIGNHDAAVLGLIETSAFNPEARFVVNWTRQVLTPENRDYLIKQTARVVAENITLAHASPRYPIWEYLLDTQTAEANFQFFETQICLVGHTHVPVIYHRSNGTDGTQAYIPEPNTQLILPRRVIANPGSVGQPRDRDPRAAYAILDTETYQWDYFRVAYDIEAVQAQMEKLELPERHIRRLTGGW
jgi:diadenosine tetraphosphatase ApaH/serine/threonine PP2A family protein phosphatase